MSFVLGGCTPTAHSLQLEERIWSDQEISVVPFAEALVDALPPPRPPTRPIPPAPPLVERDEGDAPQLQVYLSEAFDEGEYTGCELSVHASGLPAYDPATDRVLMLERFHPAMTSDLGTLDLVWIDAASDTIVDRIELLRGSNETLETCREAQQLSERGTRRAQRRLREGRWEPMPAVPLSWIEWPSLHFEALRQAKADAEENGEEWHDAVAQYVEAYPWRGELIVRVRGVQVLERLPTRIAGEDNSTQSFHAHRESGTVLATVMECAGESCTCDPITAFEVLRFRPETLARIDQFPCTTPDGSDEACMQGSAWLAAGADPWTL